MTSSYSQGSGACVAVARTGGDRVSVRHSRDESLVLEFTTAEWNAFLAGVRAGEFDLS
ncbi:DUF397 domain-containing protein [Pseudonocardia sp.]|uniref:DUF397 domain-containing protein n=1 Tax=Pseudonocardia sp. TaxID=60912 RepID=UPI003D097BDD